MNIHRHTTIFLLVDMMPDDLPKKLHFFQGVGSQSKGKEKANQPARGGFRLYNFEFLEKSRP